MIVIPQNDVTYMCVCFMGFLEIWAQKTTKQTHFHLHLHLQQKWILAWSTGFVVTWDV